MSKIERGNSNQPQSNTPPRQRAGKSVVDEFSKRLKHEKKSPSSKSSELPQSATTDLSLKPRPVPDNVFIVNNLININYQYESDQQQFKVPDYWQAPEEMKKNFKGDCEDFAILKYDALLERGVSEDRLDLAYAKLGDQAHLVMLYQGHDGHTHVLDNAVKEIETIEQREDLSVLVRFKMKDVIYGKDGWLKVLEQIRSKN